MPSSNSFQHLPRRRLQPSKHRQACPALLAKVLPRVTTGYLAPPAKTRPRATKAWLALPVKEPLGTVRAHPAPPAKTLPKVTKAYPDLPVKTRPKVTKVHPAQRAKTLPRVTKIRMELARRHGANTTYGLCASRVSLQWALRCWWQLHFPASPS